MTAAELDKKKAAEGNPACEKGHALEVKKVAGSWLGRAKACALCNAPLTAGLQRYSCKTCCFHLCDSCYSSRSLALQHEEIVVTLYRPAGNTGPLGLGGQEDTWNVRIERSANGGQLRARIEELYSLPRAQQLLRREVQGPVITDEDPLRCSNGDVLILEVSQLGIFGGGLANGSLSGIAQAVSSALADVARAGQEMQDHLQNSSIRLTFVLPEGRNSGQAEKRCELEVSPTARLVEVLEMVKLELGAENDAVGLQFGGNVLPLQVSVMTSGLQERDTVIVVRREM
mmetsp:Transcript_52419/g.125233  ORF Transcript_52419/g.125233 Transcript_52419/m.125233 type:complete len:286 (+) Transcript_52419:130-987(+)|eukprot:CAMPEP_0178413796 /NCGR_PEP_ID=MMETSP0689_2-20121128/22710_1 /TAXON_ID=160604 /ORGANISM="Amphidinium massartii, Strain CS-259" /LENGTH=285 /DNA_ID=CAMNT_0020035075 /DNA_START=64 /DNA_END=921 /DNA_ORIENTATION=+